MSDTYRRSPFRPKSARNEVDDILLKVVLQENMEELHEDDEEPSLEDYLRDYREDKSNFS